MADTIEVAVTFTIPEQKGRGAYTDRIFIPIEDWPKVQDDLPALKQARYDNWLAQLDAPPPEPEPETPVTRDDAIQAAKAALDQASAMLDAVAAESTAEAEPERLGEP